MRGEAATTCQQQKQQQHISVPNHQQCCKQVHHAVHWPLPFPSLHFHTAHLAMYCCSSDATSNLTGSPRALAPTGASGLLLALGSKARSKGVLPVQSFTKGLAPASNNMRTMPREPCLQCSGVPAAAAAATTTQRQQEEELSVLLRLPLAQATQQPNHSIRRSDVHVFSCWRSYWLAQQRYKGMGADQTGLYDTSAMPEAEAW